MLKNAKEELQCACSQLQSAVDGLNHAMETVEKPNNKKEVEKALDAIHKAKSVVDKSLQSYRD